MIRVRILFACLVTLCPLATLRALAENTREISIQELIQNAVEQDPAVNAAEFRKSAAKEDRITLFLQHLPKFDLSLSALKFDGSPPGVFSVNKITDPNDAGSLETEANWLNYGELKLGMSYDLIGGGNYLGQSISARKRRQINFSLSDNELKQARMDLASKVTQVALQKSYTQEAYDITRGKIELLEALKLRVLVEMKNTLTDELDLNEVEDRILEADIESASYANNKKALNQLIKLFLGDDSADEIIIKDIDVIRSPLGNNSNLTEKILDSSPRLQTKTLQSEDMRATIEGLRGRSTPTLSFISNYTLGTDFKQNNAGFFSVGFRVNIPINDSLGRFWDLKAAKDEQRAADADAKATERALRVEAIQLELSLSESRGKIKRLKNYIVHKVRDVEVAQQQLIQGLSSEDKIIEKEIIILDAKLRLLNEKYSELKLYTELAISTGQYDKRSAFE
ncbi:MAG: outer membrane protein TolC [Lentimonas sp.]|jgi:outer membrane protein TolC